MTCPITADRDAWRGAVTEREAALVEALEQIAGYSEVNGMTRIRMRKIAAAALARAHTAAAEGSE